MKVSTVVKTKTEEKISRVQAMNQRKKEEEEYKRIMKELNKPIKPGAIFL